MYAKIDRKHDWIYKEYTENENYNFKDAMCNVVEPVLEAAYLVVLPSNFTVGPPCLYENT